MTLPITLAGYRQRGILRRFHASSISATALVGAQLTLALMTFVAGTIAMSIVAHFGYDAMWPQDLLGVLVALLAGTAAFGAIGLLLATVIRTSRSAQGIGLLLFFALWLISGTGPPRAVLRQPAPPHPSRHRHPRPVVRFRMERHRPRDPHRLGPRGRHSRALALPLGLTTLGGPRDGGTSSPGELPPNQRRDNRRGPVTRL
jgi:hypothetical protein